MSGFCSSAITGAEPSSAFLILASLTAPGRKSAGAAAITTASAVAAAETTASRKLGGGLDPHHLGARGVGQRDVGGHERDLRAAGDRRTGEGVALEPRGAVAQEADRVEVLAGAAGRHHDVEAGEVGRVGGVAASSTSVATSKISAARAAGPCRCRPRSRRPSAGSTTTAPRRRSVATFSCVAGCSISVCIAGANTADGAMAIDYQIAEVVARGRARPCRQVCGGGGRPGRRSCRSGIASTSCTPLHVGGDGLAGQRGPGRRTDELERRGGRDDGDVVPGLGEPAEQLARLVRSNAAAHTEADVRAAFARMIRLRCLRPSGVMSSQVSRSALISRSAIDSGFSWTWVSTSGPTYSSRPSPSCE